MMTSAASPCFVFCLAVIARVEELRSQFAGKTVLLGIDEIDSHRVRQRLLCCCAAASG